MIGLNATTRHERSIRAVRGRRDLCFAPPSVRPGTRADPEQRKEQVVHVETVPIWAAVVATVAGLVIAAVAAVTSTP